VHQAGFPLHDFYKPFQQHHLPEILLTTHIARNAVSTLLYTRRNTSRHWNWPFSVWIQFWTL